MFGLGLFAVAVLALGAASSVQGRSCVRKHVCGTSQFTLSYRSPLRDKVPRLRAFVVRNTHVVVERMPDLSLHVRCRSDGDRMRHMRSIWRAFPGLTRESYDMSPVY